LPIAQVLSARGNRRLPRPFVGQADQLRSHPMESVLPGLYASPHGKLSFAPSVHTRAFLLERAAGNFLVYSAAPLAGEKRAVAELGGIARHYLNHWHEASFGGAEQVAAAFAAPVICHEAERAEVAKTVAPTRTLDARRIEDEGFEAVPIPGHTPGATAYLWDSGRHRCLFTGDSLYVRGGEWVAAVLDSSDRAAYIDSLALIKELDFDVLVPWVAAAGQPCHALTDPADKARRIDAIVERLRRGEDH
jgi:glyoxylase-like metal-dependent hydrolase (beta-lactamase superfamily II)